MVDPTKVEGFDDYPNWCKNWLIIAMDVTYYEDFKEIKVRTDRNVELTLFWALHGPIPERRVKIVRGAPTTRDPHISWHYFGWIRQEEDYELYPFGIPWIHPDWWHTFKLTRERFPGAELWFRFEGRGCGRRYCPECGTQDLWCSMIACHCNVCGAEWPPYESLWEYLARSFSPFWYEKWQWAPTMELLYHEPWTYEFFDLVLLYHEPWSTELPDFDLLFFEPWSAS